MIETRIKHEDFRNREAKVHINETDILSVRARLAAAMIEKWGMVAATPDGEDASGRQKLALLPVADLVSRACETAELAMLEFIRFGWVTQAPTFAEMDAYEAKGDSE